MLRYLPGPPKPNAKSLPLNTYKHIILYYIRFLKETISTLTVANHVKHVKTNAVTNEVLDSVATVKKNEREMKTLREENETLREENEKVKVRLTPLYLSLFLAT
jgi:cell shape-determining protein MreC